jgi:hypothetical protein
MYSMLKCVLHSRHRYVVPRPDGSGISSAAWITANHAEGSSCAPTVHDFRDTTLQLHAGFLRMSFRSSFFVMETHLDDVTRAVNTIVALRPS